MAVPGFLFYGNFLVEGVFLIIGVHKEKNTESHSGFNTYLN
jgi:hypothetical protein